MAGRKPGTPKTGGRAKGTVNKTSLEAGEMLRANGFDADLPWLYWARVLKSHLAPAPKMSKGGAPGAPGADRAEMFYQGRESVGLGEGESEFQEVWARATADMADKAAKNLAPYLRPQLMRVEGSGKGGALVVQFAEDHSQLGRPAKRVDAPAAAPALRVKVVEEVRAVKSKVKKLKV